ncbi:uncharacterized protein TNCV_336371 [Trichonephila clavipes]|nr:uncharacterized protein TNCV_336371 [Trichonephila clavipes]
MGLTSGSRCTSRQWRVFLADEEGVYIHGNVIGVLVSRRETSPPIFGTVDTLTDQLPNPSKVKQASVSIISCSVVEIDWKSFMGSKFFLLLEDETARVKTKDSLRDFGKKKK